MSVDPIITLACSRPDRVNIEPREDLLPLKRITLYLPPLNLVRIYSSLKTFTPPSGELLSLISGCLFRYTYEILDNLSTGDSRFKARIAADDLRFLTPKRNTRQYHNQPLSYRQSIRDNKI